MLRRVARVLRLLLTGIGLLLLLALPFGGYLAISFPWGTAGVVRGQAILWVANMAARDDTYAMLYQKPQGGMFSRPAMWPRIDRHGADRPFAVMIFIPLWLLAAACLAWPVTSLLVRRRRRGRGFEVEAKGGGAVPTADS